MAKASIMTIRLPKDLKKRIQLVAEDQGVSLNQLAMYMFAREVSSFETGQKLSKYWKGLSKDSILQGFDETMTKVKKRRTPNWDRLES